MKTSTADRITSAGTHPEREGRVLLDTALLPTRKAIIAPTPPMKLMIPLAWERFGEGVISGIRATTGVRHSAMLSSRVLVQATNRRQNGCQRDQAKSQRADRRADQDEGHPPPDRGAQPVRPGTHRRLDEQRRDIVQGHEETDPGSGQPKLIGQENRAQRRCRCPRSR